jgi:hypothetical protein
MLYIGAGACFYSAAPGRTAAEEARYQRRRRQYGPQETRPGGAE